MERIAVDKFMEKNGEDIYITDYKDMEDEECLAREVSYEES